MSEGRSGGVNLNWFNLLMVGLTLIFVYLKLAGVGEVAAWSWWFVFLPIWGPIALGLTIFVLVVIVICIGALFKWVLE
jgi:hypothetical protein